RGADLLSGIDARLQCGVRRADPAGGEELHVIGAVLEVLAHAATDLVHAVEGGVCPAVPVAGGDATRGAEEPRARDYPRVDGVADLNVEKALLRHHPHRGGAGGEVPAEIGRCPERLGHGSLTELADLIPGAGHDG